LNHPNMIFRSFLCESRVDTGDIFIFREEVVGFFEVELHILIAQGIRGEFLHLRLEYLPAQLLGIVFHDTRIRIPQVKNDGFSILECCDDLMEYMTCIFIVVLPEGVDDSNSGPSGRLKEIQKRSFGCLKYWSLASTC